MLAGKPFQVVSRDRLEHPTICWCGYGVRPRRVPALAQYPNGPDREIDWILSRSWRDLIFSTAGAFVHPGRFSKLSSPLRDGRTDGDIS